MAQFDHQHILKKNRVFLVGSVDLTNSSILDQLVQDGVLSVEQLMAIKSTFETNTQKVSGLLDHLHRRTPEDWAVFLKCLSDNNHQAVVDRLRTPVIDTNQCTLYEYKTINLQRNLAVLIKRFYDNVPLWTLHSDRLAIPMDDIYVSLVLVKEEQRKQSKEEPLHSYKELLRKDEDRGTIYLTGEPGVGKSTLVQRICVDWASGKMGIDRAADNETFAHYLFVLPIFLRDVKAKQTIRQVMANEYQLHETEAEALCRCLENPQNTILLILDGLDEYDENTSTEITDIIHRRRLQHITLFITSRFSSESVFSTGKPGRCTEVRLRGFSEAGVKEYIQRYFDKRKKEGNKLLTKIQKTEELEHFSHIPAILLMMATLWEESQQLPSTIVGFYKEFVAYVFARMEKRKLEKVADRAKSTENILKRYNRQIMALGCLATGNVKTHKLELNFKREDVDKHIRSEDLNNGFLIEERTFSREVFYIFIHKTVQEYFLACYLVYSDKSTQKELLLRFFKSRQAFTESAMIRRFVAGLGGKKIYKQLENLIEGSELEVAEMHTDLQLEYLAEHQDARLILPRGVKLVITDRYPTSHYVRWLSKDGRDVRKMWFCSCKERHWRLLQYLHAPQLACLQLDVWSQYTSSVDGKYITRKLNKTLKNFPLIQLTITGNPVRYVYNNDQRDESEASAIVIAAANTQTLRTLDFHMTRLTGNKMRALRQWLPVSHLILLRLCDCDLILQELMPALSVLPPSLKTLDVSKNDLAGLTDTGQVSGVTQSQLQSLVMSHCHLTCRGVSAVIDGAPETLNHLDVSNNCDWWERADDLVKVIKRTQLNQLKTLNLQYNKMSCDVVTTIKQNLAETCPHLDLSIDYQGHTVRTDGSNKNTETKTEKKQSKRCLLF